MVVGSGRRDMVGCFFGEDLSEVGIFRRERDFRFCLFGGDGEFHCCSKLSNKQGVQEETFAIALENSVDLAIVQRVLEVLVLHIMVKVIIEARVIDSVYVDVAMGSGKGFLEKGIMSLDICSVGGIKVL